MIIISMTKHIFDVKKYLLSYVTGINAVFVWNKGKFQYIQSVKIVH